MSKETMIPKIRFESFGDNWNNEILKNIASFSKGKGYKRSDTQNNGTPIIFYGDMYTDFQNIITRVSNFVDEKPNSVKSSGDEIIIPSSGETAEDIAIASVVKNKGIILGGDLNIIKLQSEFNSHYLSLSLTYGKSKNELIKRAQGSSIIHLYNRDIKKSKIIYPSLKEQQKIGKLFKKLDQIISLQQQVLDATKDYKQSMLQKMFPKKAEKVPQLRFDEIDDEWTYCKFEDIAEVSRGLTYRPKDLTDQKGTRVLRSSNINIDQFKIFSDDVFVNDDAVNISNVNKNDIIITSANGSKDLVGKHAVIDDNLKKAVVGGFMYSVKTKYPYFLNSWMHTDLYREILRLVQGGGGSIGNLPIDALKKQNILIPPLEEQKKINYFFEIFDQKIKQEEKKLETYQSMKKALMQRMFV